MANQKLLNIITIVVAAFILIMTLITRLLLDSAALENAFAVPTTSFIVLFLVVIFSVILFYSEKKNEFTLWASILALVSVLLEIQSPLQVIFFIPGLFLLARLIPLAMFVVGVMGLNKK